MTSAEGCPGSRGLMQPRRPGGQHSLFAAGGQSPCCTESRQGTELATGEMQARFVGMCVWARSAYGLPHKTFTTANRGTNDSVQL